MGIIPKFAKFLGIDKFGQGLATAGRVISGEVKQDTQNQMSISNNVQMLNYAAKKEADPVKKKRLLSLAQGFGTGTSAAEIDPGLNLSNKEILGSAANVALNVATPGAFKGGKAAVIGKNAALGAGFGAASGLEKNRSAKGIVGSTVGGGAIGAGIGVATIGARALKDFLTKTTPEWLMNTAVKPSLDEARKSVKYGRETLGKELLDEGVKGGPEKMLQIADDKIKLLEDDLQNVLNNAHLSGATIERNSLNPYIQDALAHQKKIPGGAGNVQRIQAIFKTIPEKMTLQRANEMKRAIYQELRSPAYKLDAKLTAKAQVLKSIAHGLKQEIEKTVGGTVVGDINRKLSLYGRLEDRIVDQLARSMRNHRFGLTDAILAAGGIASLTPAGLLLSIGGIGARHAGAALETGTAQALNKLQDVGTGVVAKTLKGVLKRGALNVP